MHFPEGISVDQVYVIFKSDSTLLSNFQNVHLWDMKATKVPIYSQSLKIMNKHNKWVTHDQLQHSIHVSYLYNHHMVNTQAQESYHYKKSTTKKPTQKIT